MSTGTFTEVIWVLGALTVREVTHLVVVEDGVGHGVFSWHSVCPQLLHEEHLIRQWRHNTYTHTHTQLGKINQEEETLFPLCFTIFHVSGFLDPVSQVSHKVKEEVAIRHTDDLHNQKPSLNHLNVCDVSHAYNNKNNGSRDVRSPSLWSSRTDWNLQMIWAGDARRCCGRSLWLWCSTPLQTPGRTTWGTSAWNWVYVGQQFYKYTDSVFHNKCVSVNINLTNKTETPQTEKSSMNLLMYQRWQSELNIWTRFEPLMWQRMTNISVLAGIYGKKHKKYIYCFSMIHLFCELLCFENMQNPKKRKKILKIKKCQFTTGPNGLL